MLLEYSPAAVQAFEDLAALVLSGAHFAVEGFTRNADAESMHGRRSDAMLGTVTDPGRHGDVVLGTVTGPWSA